MRDDDDDVEDGDDDRQADSDQPISMRSNRAADHRIKNMVLYGHDDHPHAEDRYGGTCSFTYGGEQIIEADNNTSTAPADDDHKGLMMHRHSQDHHRAMFDPNNCGAAATGHAQHWSPPNIPPVLSLTQVQLIIA